MTTREQDNEDRSAAAQRRRLNIVSVLLPCRRYRLTCSWTREEPLPALEEQACRLLMIIEETSARELQDYFCLSRRERDVLVNTLREKGLVETSESGSLVASALLKGKARGASDGGTPTLTRYDTREEEPVFDLLACTLMPRRRYSGAKFGLPEVASDVRAEDHGLEGVKEAFSRQYRLHLENTVSSPREVENTRLYKIGNARRAEVLQVPIDMEFNADFRPGGDVVITRDAVERVGQVRTRGLSNEIESEIADFLGTLEVPAPDRDFQAFCDEVGDEVLRRYTSGEDFALAEWTQDREKRRTGYGNPWTEAMIGPVYLDSNRAEILDRLRSAEKQVKEETGFQSEPFAFWSAADVPLWAANGTQLETFVNRVESRIGRLSDEVGHIVGLFPLCSRSTAAELKSRFHARLPNGWGLDGESGFGRTEIFLVPDILAVAQYHVQPNPNSAFTYPVGHVTSDPERVGRLSQILSEKVANFSGRKLLWSGYSKYEIEPEDLGDRWLSSAVDRSGGPTKRSQVGQEGEKVRRENRSGTQIVWKKKRRRYKDKGD